MIADQTKSSNGTSSNGTSSPLGLTPLITGILADAQALIGQQLSLFQTEMKHDLGRTRDAAIPLGVGVAVAHLAGIFLFMTVAHFILWLRPELPAFAAYGIVGGFLAVVAAGFIIVGKTRFDAFNLLPAKSVEGLKENVQWQTKT